MDSPSDSHDSETDESEKYKFPEGVIIKKRLPFNEVKIGDVIFSDSFPNHLLRITAMDKGKFGYAFFNVERGEWRGSGVTIFRGAMLSLMEVPVGFLKEREKGKDSFIKP